MKKKRKKKQEWRSLKKPLVPQYEWVGQTLKPRVIL
jgi:hypothetical protein